MCGIAGIFSPIKLLDESAEARMSSALDFQKHRGPDALGTWMNGNLILGHNRLSIIDLSHSADQPLYREDLGLRIVFNGEIYNYRTLKIELEGKGYTFSTSSDTEILLAGYHAYGKSICTKLTGMFAFAIWDERKQEVFLARDRFGEKPIFFIEDGDMFFFASELKALRSLYSKPLVINHNAVIDLVENLYIDPTHSIYEQVGVFPSALSLKIDKKGQKTWDRYYHLPTQVKEQIDFETLKKTTRNKLYEIVNDQLNADVPVATFLSAGVDSGLITAIAKDIKSDITAVTMTTNESSTDETEGAMTLAKKLDIKHELVPVTTDSIDVLATNLKDIQPLADASLIPSHLVTNQVKGRYTVMLSGDGGDEIFGSYNKPNLFLNHFKSTIPFGAKLVKMGLQLDHQGIGSKIKSRLNDSTRIQLGGWPAFYANTNLSGGFFSKVFRKGAPQLMTLKVLEELMPRYKGNEEKTSFGVDIQTRLPGDFLLKVDTAAMHSSIEVRAPFLDHELVDFLMGVPTQSLMPNQIDKELSKSLLSDFSGSNWHPPKRGFTIPYWEYLQHTWGDQLQKYLMEGFSEEYFYFNKKGILDILQRHRTKPSPQLARILFAVLVLEIWLREFHLKNHPVLYQK